MSNAFFARSASACIRPLAAGAVLAAGFLAIPQAANAATVTDTITVTATVQSACIVAANPLAFGNYNPTSSTNLDATTSISVTCTQGTPYSVGLNAGAGSGATTTLRKLTSSTRTINYSLYQDAARTTNWGNTVSTDTVNGTAGAAAAVITVYGRIPASQNNLAGSYTDTVTVTVTY